MNKERQKSKGSKPPNGSELFRGLGVALITPFRRDEALDERAFRKFLEWQIAEGTDFLVPCGTTGENPALTADEHLRVIELAVEVSAGRVPVLAGAGSNSTPKAVELARSSVELGADGILTITPYYNKPTPDGLLRHFGAQANALEKLKSGFPMIAYNVPGRTGVNMSAATTIRLARKIPNLVGVKEASANMEQILQILRDKDPEFLVLSGDDAWTLPLVAAGAGGVISVAGNEVPRLMKELVSSALAGDLASARVVHNRLLALMTGNFMESNPIPVKAALKMMGVLKSDTVRSPLAAMSGENLEAMRAILREARLT
ncbi:MAG TPA: 4-hydroxy-tetrahydrodipicolinate synthase [Thermoanaerobaculia bacterium]|nr:4-hydroxy-tetrahydrodipicolinate synthase [Thermoanaerobaculia bacterium]